MRKVMQVREPRIYLDELDDRHIIGIESANGSKKAQVMKVSGDKYTTCTVGDNNEYLWKTMASSIEELVQECWVKAAYVFEDREEFIKWLTK